MNRAPLAFTAVGSEAERRRRRRELMRAHHPDLGGDPAVYIQVLQSLDEGGASERTPTEVRFAKRRRWRVPNPPRPFRRQRPKRVL
jgi:hypothetical protein